MSTPPPDLITFCEGQYPRLVGALGLYCGNRDVAEDLAQEALARVCANWDKVKRKDSPEAWAHRIGINLAHSYFRRRAAERRAVKRLDGAASAEAETTIQDRVALLDLIRRLPHRQRSAVILRYYLGFTIPEVARVLDCPDGTVKTLVHRAVKAMEIAAEPLDVRGAHDVV